MSNSATPRREMTRRELFKMLVPAGLVKHAELVLDRNACTACAICAAQCPAGAIDAAGEESLVITFYPDRCNACSECVEACPERCLKLETGKKTAAPVVLFEDDFARCIECGTIIGSRQMLTQMKARLAAFPNLQDKIELCPACKSRQAQLGLSLKEGDRDG